MQHAKLYNLHKTASLIVTCFAFEVDKMSSGQTSMLFENIGRRIPSFSYSDYKAFQVASCRLFYS